MEGWQCGGGAENECRVEEVLGEVEGGGVRRFIIPLQTALLSD